MKNEENGIQVLYLQEVSLKPRMAVDGQPPGEGDTQTLSPPDPEAKSPGDQENRKNSLGPGNENWGAKGRKSGAP